MKVIIIGNGISGITAAKYLREQSLEVDIQVISEETTHFFARTALMYVFMQHMKEQDLFPHEKSFWEKNRIQLTQGRVVHVDTQRNEVVLENRETLPYDVLILAMGSKTKNLDVIGSDLHGIQGFYSWKDLKTWQKEIPMAQSVAIIGGGLIGVELAEMMVSANKKTYLLIREESYWRRVLPSLESKLISEHIESHGVHLLKQTEVLSFTGEQGRVKQLQLSSGEILKVDWVGMSIGVEPRIGEFSMPGLEVDRGVLVNAFLETSVSKVYAIGDCAQYRIPPQGRSSIEAMWYTGRNMGAYVASRILGSKEEYNSGIYFNSAKFFDLEYQIYGLVPAHDKTEIHTFFWAHEKKVFRIAFRSLDQKIVGVSGIGIRLRQEVWTHWIQTETSVVEALQKWEEGSFDPEFTPQWGKEIRKAYTAQTGIEFKSAKRWNWLKK